ncbi:MAG: flagellar biosynthesis protein FlhB [Vampirovibrionales bacterium]|nr:flagellar biosynthesis protein FlhB [Vampirovibrionales bacterium]
MGDENKQFEATPHKLRKAREQGQVFKSKDLSSAAFLIAMFMGLFAAAPLIWHEIAGLFIQVFEQIPNATIEKIGWQYLAVISLKALVILIAPFLFGAALLSIAGDFFQVGPIFSTKSLSPNFGKLNPVKGFQNIFSQRTLVELAKNIVKVLILGVVGYLVFSSYIEKLLKVGEAENIFVIMTVLGEVLTKFILYAGIAFFAIGLADFLFQRWKFMQDQKMSFKEMKDEFKNTEGDPMIKQALRQRRMQLLQQSMLEAVPTADVVTTNPIHVAVALKYNAEMMEAPRVVAKGTELFAQRIKEIAQDNGIPIVENPVVARTLFRFVEIDQEIPPDLYQAVAEILMFAWRARGVTPPNQLPQRQVPNTPVENAPESASSDTET